MKNKKPSDKKYDKDEEKRKNEIDLEKAQKKLDEKTNGTQTDNEEEIE